MRILDTMSSKEKSTRTRILSASWELLESNQGQGVRMTDIAKRAGISRQALYLHFKTRAELLVATTRHVDEVKGVDSRLASSRAAKTGIERLENYIDAWGNYIPEIYGIAKALLAMRDTDAEAATAWDDRMQALRHGCVAIIDALIDNGNLASAYKREEAVDMLWTMLSVRNWEQLVIDCGWDQQRYVAMITQLAKQNLVEA